jgi:hypothetical protein
MIVEFLIKKYVIPAFVVMAFTTVGFVALSFAHAVGPLLSLSSEGVMYVALGAFGAAFAIAGYFLVR